MAKKGKANAADEASATARGDTTPGFKDYIKAVWLMAFEWVKKNKLKFLILLLISATAITLIVLLARPSVPLPDNDQIVIQVNKELGIAGDGNPAVLTVEDESRAVQPFLEQAENGDKVLLYYKAKKAVLFRPAENRIVHHGSYTPPDAKVFIRKGTADNGKVEELRTRLEQVSDIEIVSQDSSPRQDYQGITLVSVTDRYDDKIRELEELFDTQVVRLPSGESFPEADILIIVGN